MAAKLTTTVFEVFSRAVEAIQGGQLIRRQNKNDKEFHFQNWFKARLGEVGHSFEQGGRNSYPDFKIGHCPIGS